MAAGHRAREATSGNDLVGWFPLSPAQLSDDLELIGRGAAAAGSDIILFCSDEKFQMFRQHLLSFEERGVELVRAPVPAPPPREIYQSYGDHFTGLVQKELNDRPAATAVFDFGALAAGEPGQAGLREAARRLAQLAVDNQARFVAECNPAALTALTLIQLVPYFHRFLTGGRFWSNAYHITEQERQGREDLRLLLDHLADASSLLDTEEKRSAAPIDMRARTSQKLLEAIVDSMGEGIFVTDERGSMLLCNKRAQQILGYGYLDLPLEERVRTIGNFLPDTVTPYPIEELPITKAINGESVDEAEIYIRNAMKQEGTWIRSTGRPLRDHEGRVRGGVVVFRDITSHKQQIRKNLLLEARISQRQKLEGLGLLAGGIAHDFNNLLMGVLGNAGMALLECPPGSAMQQRIEQIKTGALRLSELTNQLLAYSGRGSFSEESLNLSGLVQEMQGLLERVVSKRAEFRGNFCESLPLIKADATQVRQIVMNLITNASDALADEPGVITVTTGHMEADREYLLHCVLGDDLKEGEYVYVQVADTGCGMDAETQERIFDPFFTTKLKGRGLGLASVLGLVRRHGGALNLESAPGRGTKFTVLFPSLKSYAALSPGKAPRDAVARGEGTILVVDDERVVRDVTRQILEFAGFTVLAAANGREGVKVFNERRKDIVLVLLDMTMPDIGGEQVFKELRKKCADLRIIVSSGYVRDRHIDRLLTQGYSAFLQKPYVPEVLLSKIQELIKRD